LPFILLMFALSPWSGGLVARYGARIPLIVGPLVAACGFALFLRPGIGDNYWTDFFPPVAVLGLGMAISVAPLTTVVMSSVSETHAGVASGVNNAVARTAGLVAIAVFGIIMLQVFKGELNRRLAESRLPSSVAQSVQTQSNKLAAIEIPADQNPNTQKLLRRAIDESFVSGFRAVMIVGALLATASSLTGAVLIRTPPRT
jgi:Major Facilitator Superfamily